MYCGSQVQFMGDEEYEKSLGNIGPIKEGMLCILHQTPWREYINLTV